MRGKLHGGAAAAVVVAAALCAGGADANSGRRADLDLGFTTRSPASATGLVLRILYKDERDPNAKPQPIRDLILDAPAGTRFDGAALPRCGASDQELMALGRAACPAASEVGRGTLSVFTGFGPPFDPLATDTTLYNGGDQIIELVTQRGGNLALGSDRLHFEGSSRLHAHPPTLPGGPPDGQTAVREVTARIEPHGAFVTTPPVCPAERSWSASGTFGFADGVRETVATSIPCVAAARATRPQAMRVRVAPRRVAAARRVRFALRVSSSTVGCRGGVSVRLHGHSARTGASGRATIATALPRAGRYRVRASKPGCVVAATAVRAVGRRGPRFAG